MFSYRGGTMRSFGLAIESSDSGTGEMRLAIYDTYKTTDSGASLRGGFPKNFLGQVIYTNMDTVSGTLLTESVFRDINEDTMTTAPTLDADTWYWMAMRWTGNSRYMRGYNLQSAHTEFQMPIVGTWGNGWRTLVLNSTTFQSSYATSQNWGGSGPGYLPVVRYEYA